MIRRTANDSLRSYSAPPAATADPSPRAVAASHSPALPDALFYFDGPARGVKTGLPFAGHRSLAQVLVDEEIG